MKEIKRFFLSFFLLTFLIFSISKCGRFTSGCTCCTARARLTNHVIATHTTTPSYSFYISLLSLSFYFHSPLRDRSFFGLFFFKYIFSFKMDQVAPPGGFQLLVIHELKKETQSFSSTDQPTAFFLLRYRKDTNTPAASLRWMISRWWWWWNASERVCVDTPLSVRKIQTWPPLSFRSPLDCSFEPKRIRRREPPTNSSKKKTV